jgi:plastocyanin
MIGGLRRGWAVLALAFALVGIGAALLGNASGATANAVVKIVDFRFVPGELTIPEGGTVRWVWSSRNKKPHDVYLAAAPAGVRKGSYSSRRAVKNAEFKRTFKTPGTYDFLCSVHPGMHLEVTVRG